MVVPGKRKGEESLCASSRIILMFWAFHREIRKRKMRFMKIKNRDKIIN